MKKVPYLRGYGAFFIKEEIDRKIFPQYNKHKLNNKHISINFKQSKAGLLRIFSRAGEKAMNENDLRVIKTMEAVESSFLDMLDELPAEKITVRELSRRAKINTGTFYLHFQNIDDLYDKLIQAFFDEFIASIDYFPLFISQPELFLKKLRNTVHQKIAHCRRLFKHRDMSLSKPCLIRLLRKKIYESCPLEVSRENDIRLEAVLTSLFHMNLKYDQECPEIIQKVFTDMIRGLFVTL